MVTFHKIIPQTVEVCRNGEHFAICNQYEFNDLRIQIKNDKDTSFTVKFRNQHVPIDKDGRLFYPKGLFDLIMDQLFQLL